MTGFYKSTTAHCNHEATTAKRGVDWIGVIESKSIWGRIGAARSESASSGSGQYRLQSYRLKEALIPTILTIPTIPTIYPGC